MRVCVWTVGRVGEAARFVERQAEGVGVYSFPNRSVLSTVQSFAQKRKEPQIARMKHRSEGRASSCSYLCFIGALCGSFPSLVPKQSMGTSDIVGPGGQRHLLEVNHIPIVTRLPEIWQAYCDDAIQWLGHEKR